jgi:hypothetical protein
MTTLGNEIPLVNSSDDLFHDRSDDPYWNESAYFHFLIPERKAAGFFYVFHRPNMKASAGGVALWDPTGWDVYDCLFHEWYDYQPIAPEAEMFSFTMDCGLSAECPAPLNSYRLAHAADGFSLDLTFEAFMEPVCPKRGVQAWGLGSGHYEQAGRMRGTVELEGENLAVDCMTFRDHSWGPRRPTAWKNKGGYQFAFHSESSGFVAWTRSDLPADTNPIFGVTEELALGWYIRAGVLAELVSGERRVVERGSDGRPLRVVLDAVDELGRELHAEAECENVLRWNAFTHLFNWSCLARWDFDGHAGIWGDAEDMHSVRQNRRIHRILQPDRDRGSVGSSQ